MLRSVIRIAVVGGTGTVGRRIVAALARDGHDVRTLSRGATDHRVDLTTGAGLEAALGDCEVVIDASNGRSSRSARAVLVEGSRRLLEAEARAGVGHHVCVSIVGIEDVPIGYYRVKFEQERVVEAAGVPWTIVRSAQFHDLLGEWLSAAARWHVLPTASVRLQPVDVSEAAAVIAGAAGEQPRLARTTVAGPEVQDLRTLARLWGQATRRRAIELPIPLLGRTGRALREGRLTCPSPDVRGTRTFADWLQELPG